MQNQETHSTEPNKAKASRDGHWSLAPYLERRLVVLHKDESMRAAVRAMEANGIGAILVEDKGVAIGIVTDRDLAIGALGYDKDGSHKTLQEFLRRPLESVGVNASLSDVVDLMSRSKIRRVPILDIHGHARGLVTLDDLLAEGMLTPQQISEIVWVQLAQATQFKRLGDVGPTQPQHDGVANMKRSIAHSLQTLIPLLDNIANRAGFSTRAKAEEALLSVTEMLVQRVTPEQAQAFLAQLPSQIADYLSSLALGPDTSINAEVFFAQVSKNMAVSEERAIEISQIVIEALDKVLTGGLLARVLGQLPKDIKQRLKPSDQMSAAEVWSLFSIEE